MSTLPARLRAVADLLDEVDASGVSITVYEDFDDIYLQGALPSIVALANHLGVTLRTGHHSDRLYHRAYTKLDGHNLSIFTVTPAPPAVPA